MKNVEPYSHVFRCSFGFNVAVTKSEYDYYRVLKILLLSEQIGVETYLNSQWQLLQYDWQVID